MIVTLKKFFCQMCSKVRWHEIIHSPCCVVCQTYNLTDEEPIKLEIERFVD